MNNYVTLNKDGTLRKIPVCQPIRPEVQAIFDAAKKPIKCKDVYCFVTLRSWLTGRKRERWTLAKWRENGRPKKFKRHYYTVYGTDEVHAIVGTVKFNPKYKGR
jgi:hypothetical protein